MPISKTRLLGAVLGLIILLVFGAGFSAWAQEQQGGEEAEKAKPTPAWLKARQLILENEPGQALELLNAATEANPNNLIAWHLKALAQAASGQSEAAMRSFDVAVLELPLGYGDYLRQRGEVLVDLDREQEALTIFEEAVVQMPNDPAILGGMAKLLMLEGINMDRAEKLALRAVAVQPDNPDYWLTMGLARQAQGKNAAAVVSFHRVLRLDPESNLARSQLLASLKELTPQEVSRLLGQSRKKK